LTTKDDGARQENRRRTPRYPFVANAEFSETKSVARIQARVSEIGLNGCYLETPNPPPDGTQILVNVFKGAEFLECFATVAYSQPNRGMGIKFSNVNALFLPTLQKWILEAMHVAHD
jgi:PilZ domain-containing protein